MITRDEIVCLFFGVVVVVVFFIWKKKKKNKTIWYLYVNCPTSKGQIITFFVAVSWQ